MPKPLFVVGKHRSGTTWLGNLLLDHPQVAGIQHEKHQGIHESAFFSHVDGRYGDLQVFSNFAEFAAVIAQSDYFQLAGVSFDGLIEMYPSDYAKVFQAVMDKFAKENDAEYWIEKSPMHTHLIREIGETYTSAKFVGIIRNPVDTAFSWLGCQDQKALHSRLSGLARVTIDKYVADSHMLKMKAAWPERVHIIQYENLCRNRNDVLRSVCDFLDLSFIKVESKYQPNTSYSKARENYHQPLHEEVFVKLLYFYILRIVPPGFLSGIKKAYHKNSSKDIPDWFFKLSA